jgi:hypothetical protein
LGRGIEIGLSFLAHDSASPLTLQEWLYRWLACSWYSRDFIVFHPLSNIEKAWAQENFYFPVSTDHDDMEGGFHQYGPRT